MLNRVKGSNILRFSQKKGLICDALYNTLQTSIYNQKPNVCGGNYGVTFHIVIFSTQAMYY